MNSGRRSTIRTDELRLTVLSAVLAVVGLWVVALSDNRTVSIQWHDLRRGALYGGFLVLATLFWNLVRFKGDQILLPLVSVLALIGYVMLLRLQSDLTNLDPRLSGLAYRQGIYLGVGLILLIGFGRFFRSWHLLHRYRYSLLLVCIGLLLVTFVFGKPINGAKLWISVGPVQVQPSEIIKIGLVLFLASYLADHEALMDSTWKVGLLRLPPIPYLVPMALMWGTSLLVLVVENDLGSALLLFGIFLTMVYVGTGRSYYVLAGMIAFAIACFIALSLFSRIGIRVQNWMDPWRDPLDSGYQQIQSDFAISGGGVLGVGLSNGQPWRIPAVETDFIYSAIGEEFGLLGTIAILALFGVLVARGFSIALRANDLYLRLVAVGLSASLGIQTAVILGGVLRLIPLTGITLPFVSYGGSSMLTNFVIVGLLANISSQQRRAGTGT
jgi:cell division protein FtsW (lipid II flippase)